MTEMRQIRFSYYPNFDMKAVWEAILRLGGPGIKTEKNYMITPSSALWNAMFHVYPNMGQSPEIGQVIHGVNEYCLKYPLTMLIQD